MSNLIKIYYACTDKPRKAFLISVHPSITCNEFLKAIGDKQKKTYISLFYEKTQLSDSDSIKNFLESNKQAIFFASPTNEPPTSEFINIINSELSLKQDTVKPKVVMPISLQNPIENPNINPSEDDNLSIYKSVITDRYTKVPESEKNKFTFFFTGSTKKFLIEGIPVELDLNMNPYECSIKLKEELKKNKVDIENKSLIVYLSGGIPFISGSLKDLYLWEHRRTKRFIYGVLTNQISDSILRKEIYEVCDVSDEYHKSLISPLCESTERGLSDMACLLGYFNRNGKKTDFLFKIFSYIIHFPPLLTSLKKIIENFQIVGRDVVTVCSTLFTYIKFYLPEVNDENLYEHIFEFCSLIQSQEVPNDYPPVILIDIDSNNKEYGFLSSLKLGPSVYFWSNDDFDFCDFQNDNHQCDILFSPIRPLSIKNSFSCSIVKGKDHEYLYLMPSCSKSFKNQELFSILDPIKGITEIKDVEIFAKEQNNEEKDGSQLFDPDEINQIIMINLDESISMVDDLDGNFIPPNSDKVSRATIAFQYISIFLSKIHERSSIQGLVSFNDEIKLECPLTPLVNDFEDKYIKNFQPKSKPRLWDSILFSAQEICKFRNDCSTNTDKFKNSCSRILVISNSEDDKSVSKVEDVVSFLIQNNIVVDCIVVNKNDNKDSFQMLCAVCHASCGFAFRPQSIEEGISLVEQEAFFDFESRRPRMVPLIPGDRTTIQRRLKKERINEDLMNKAKECSEFDTSINNKFIQNGNIRARLAEPKRILSLNLNTNIPNQRARRILKELYIASNILDPNNKYYDPDVIIYPFQACLDRWKVFIKGPVNTLYENKWWFLYITFPSFYPYQPPILRFISVPYHLNVSSEGLICLDILGKSYTQYKHVTEIIQEIKELFLVPSIDTPVNIESYIMFLNNREQYYRRVMISTSSDAKNDYKKYIDDVIIVNEVPPDIIFEQFDFTPTCRISPISGKTIKKENLFLASSGVYYDKNELIQLLKTSKNPICAITGKVLTEKFDDFDNL